MAQDEAVGSVEKIRDALAVVAVLVAVGALAFAVSAFVQSGGPGEAAQAIAKGLEDVQVSLNDQNEKVSRLSRKVTALDTRLTELAENADGILAGGQRPSGAEVAKLVRREVQAALQKKAEELERSGLPVARKAADSFRRMADSVIRASGAGRNAPKVRAVLESMRAGLNQLSRKHAPGKKMPWKEFQKLAAPVRKSHVDRLRASLSPDQRKKLDAWLKSVKDPYARRFFGLGP